VILHHAGTMATHFAAHFRSNLTFSDCRSIKVLPLAAIRQCRWL